MRLRSVRPAGIAAIIGMIALLAGTSTLADVIQREGLRVTMLAQVQPYKLPRTGTAPIAVFIAGHLQAVDGSVPSQLKRMTILVNRHGLLQDRGLPKCGLQEIKTASTERALANCDDALVGSGQFWASIVLPSQRPYRTRGRLLVFNGKKGGRRALLAHIFTRNPFPSSFVVSFLIQRISQGPYGTKLTASLPQALGSWGYVDRIKLTLRRRYRYRGRQFSYFNAGCPAPKGAAIASYPLARTSFTFAEDRVISLSVGDSCGVEE